MYQQKPTCKSHAKPTQNLGLAVKLNKHHADRIKSTKISNDLV